MPNKRKTSPSGTLPAGIPKLTLGWGVLRWCSKYIKQPDGPNAGAPWQYTASQTRFILWFYAVDAQGRWLYRRAALRWAKGKGKSPMLATLCLAELCGPVVFDHFDPTADGGCVGRPAAMPWVQIAATAEWQTVNTMAMVLAMAPKSSRLAREYDLDIGKTIVYKPGGGRLEVITASARAAEGNRPTFVVLDEVQEWTPANGGHSLARTIRRNLGKTGGRSVEAGNAHAPGEGSVAEQTWEAFRLQSEGRLKDAGVLYDAVEAPSDVDLSDPKSLRAALEVAYVDAPWADLDRIVGEIQDYNTPPEDARRYYLNQVWAATDAWLAAPEWNACADVTKVVSPSDPVVLGFDGSRKRSRGVTDATALIGCRVADGHLFEIRVCEQPANERDWQVPAVEVDAEVRGAFAKYNVVGFYADPALWESYVAGWEAQFGARLKVKSTRDHPIEWWMTGGRSSLTVRALEQFHSAVVDTASAVGGALPGVEPTRELTHDGSSTLTRHALNARRRVSRTGLQIAKESPDSARKIDAVVAAVLAWQCRLDAVAAGLATQRKLTVPRRIR